MANMTIRMLITKQELRSDDSCEVTAKRMAANEWEDTLTFSVDDPQNWPVGRYIDVMAHPYGD